MGVQVADTLAWLSDELRSECSQPVLQRARGIANQWRSKMEDLHCLNDTASNRITLYATIRGTTSPSSRYEVQATLDFADELFLARYCSCPAFSGSQRGYGSYRTFDYHNSPKYAASTMTTTTITSTTTTISAPAARTATSTMMTTRLPPPAAGTPACAST